MKLSIYWIFLLIGVLFFTACDKNDPPPTTNTRTVLVYMAADNNLYGNTTANIEGMIAGSNDINGTLLVYIDPRGNGYPELRKITPWGEETIIIYENEADQNSASPSTLSKVINDARRLYPADSYGLVLWSHAKAWIPKTVTSYSARSRFETDATAPPGLETKWFGQDESSNSYMDISELAQVLPSNKSFEFIIFDACLMSNIESYYTLRNSANYLIGSPAEIMAAGFPYDKATPHFFTTDFKPEKVCQAFMDYYNSRLYNYAGQSFHTGAIAAVKTSELSALATTVKSLVDAGLPSMPINDLRGILRYEKYSYPALTDMNAYLQKCAELDPSLSDKYTSFKTQLGKTVVYKDSTPRVYGNIPSAGLFTVDAQLYSGISMFVPNSDNTLNEPFKLTEWAKATGQD